MSLTMHSPDKPKTPEERWADLRKVIEYKFTTCTIAALARPQAEDQAIYEACADEHRVLLVLMGELDGRIKTKEDADTYLKTLGGE